MEKTIKCASCNMDYTFEENPKYPRKYCLPCSEAKKQLFHGEGPTTHDRTEEVKPEVVKIPAKVMPEGVYKTPKDNGFHLTDENVNISSVELTIRAGYRLKDNEFWDIVDMMKHRILTGE